MCALIVLLLSTGLIAQEQVTFSISDLEGKTAEHEYVFSSSLTSDRGDQLAYPGGGEVDVEIQGTWKTLQTRAVDDSTGHVVATAKIKDGDSWAKMGGQKLTFEQYPFTIEQLNDLDYTWHLRPDLGIDSLEAAFRPWKVKQRTDVVNDLAMIWFGSLLPHLPDGPVRVGDTWTGERKIELPFYKLGARKRKFRLEYTSTYTLKDIKKKKGNQIAIVEEERELTVYSGWVETVSFSVMLDEGTGTGMANWEIDATNGVVNKGDYIVTVNKPLLQRYGHDHPVRDAIAYLKLLCEFKLKKLK